MADNMKAPAKKEPRRVRGQDGQERGQDSAPHKKEPRRVGPRQSPVDPPRRKKKNPDDPVQNPDDPPRRKEKNPADLEKNPDDPPRRKKKNPDDPPRKKEKSPALQSAPLPLNGKRSKTIDCTNEQGERVKITVHQVRLGRVPGIAIRYTLPGELRDPLEKRFTVDEARVLQKALSEVLG